MSTHHKVWFAVCSDIFDHEIVGMHVQPPKPDAANKAACAPMLAWLWLIREAAHQDRKRIIKGKVIPLRRGQVVVSVRYLARELNWTYKAVRVFIDRLARHGMVETTCVRIESKRGAPITVLTICNYDIYQHKSHMQGRSKGAARAQQGHKTLHRYIEDREDTSSSINPKGLEEEGAAHLQLAPAVVEALRQRVGQTYADELVAKYLANPYAKTARVIDRAFQGWLKRTYGIVISIAGKATPTDAEVLALCPQDAAGRPVIALPSAVTAQHDWRARAGRRR
jgi:hypothetical protein